MQGIYSHSRIWDLSIPSRGVLTAEDVRWKICIGLLKAIDKFDLSYDVRFSTYAVPMIAGEIKRFLRDDGMIKVSRSLKEMAVKVCMTREKLEKDYGREPTLEEVSEEIGATREEIVMAMESASEVESLHKTIYQGDGNAISLMDGIKEEKDASEELLDHMLLNSLLGTLEEKERDLLRLRYFEDLTQVQVAKQHSWETEGTAVKADSGKKKGMITGNKKQNKGDTTEERKIQLEATI